MNRQEYMNLFHKAPTAITDFVMLLTTLRTSDVEKLILSFRSHLKNDKGYNKKLADPTFKLFDAFIEYKHSLDEVSNFKSRDINIIPEEIRKHK